MKIIDRLESIIWIFLISLVVYFILPISMTLIMKPKTSSIICVFLINVIYSFIICLVHAKKHGFKWYFPIIIGMLFIPFSLLLYTEVTIIYFVLYVLVGLVSELICYKYLKKE